MKPTIVPQLVINKALFQGGGDDFPPILRKIPDGDVALKSLEIRPAMFFS